jgi:pilus assembly protein CpaE
MPNHGGPLPSWFRNASQWDGPLVNSYLIEHSSGVKILPAPLRPEDAELVSADHVEKIIAILRESYDFIIIDSSPYMSDALLSALDTSNQIIFLMTMDLPAVKNAKLGLRLLTGLNHSGKTKLVINRGSKQFGIDLKDIEKTIDFLAAAEIPSEGNTVVNAANKGIPFIISSPSPPSAKRWKMSPSWW